MEVLQRGDIVRHLIHGIHSGEHRENSVQPRGKPQRPAGTAGFRFRIFEDLLHGLGRCRQKSAFYRFHDHHRFPVLPGHFIYGPGLDGRVFPVGIVDLKLNKFRIRVPCQHFLQFLGRGVEGESVMADLSRFLHFLHKRPHIEIFEEMGAWAADVMEQIEIKVTCSRLFQ